MHVGSCRLKRACPESALPLPPGISDLREDPNPEFKGTVSSTSYTTAMSLPELVSFYKHEFEKRGLKEVTGLEQVEATGFSLVFRGPWSDREVVVQGTDFANARHVGLRFEGRRDTK